MKIHRIAVSFLVPIIAAPIALADPMLSTFARVDGPTSCGSPGGAIATANCGGSVNFELGGIGTLHAGDIEGTANAIANYGALGVYARLEMDSTAAGAPFGAPLTIIGQSAAQATFIDTLTINAPGLEGSAGQVVFSVELDGSGQLTTTNPVRNSIGALVTVSMFQNGTKCCHNVQGIMDNGTITGGILVFAPLHFTFGTPSEFGFFLEAALGGQFFGDVVQETDGVLDFAATVADLQVFDNSGNPVTGFQALSGSGASYPFQATTVIPEPASQYLLMGVLAVLGVVMRRRLKT